MRTLLQIREIEIYNSKIEIAKIGDDYYTKGSQRSFINANKDLSSIYENAKIIGEREVSYIRENSDFCTLEWINQEERIKSLFDYVKMFIDKENKYLTLDSYLKDNKDSDYCCLKTLDLSLVYRIKKYIAYGIYVRNKIELGDYNIITLAYIDLLMNNNPKYKKNLISLGCIIEKGINKDEISK